MHHHNHRHALSETYNICAETHHGDGVLNRFVFSLAATACLVNHSCDVTYVVMCTLGHNNNVAKCYSVWTGALLNYFLCESFRYNPWLIFARVLMAYSKLLLFQRIPWATETALFWQNLCIYPLIYPPIRYPQGQGKTCYQKCGCHLMNIKLTYGHVVSTWRLG